MHWEVAPLPARLLRNGSTFPWISRQPFELSPQVPRRFTWLEPWRPEHNSAAFAKAVPCLRRRDARDLVGHVVCRRLGSEIDGERLQTWWLVLPHHEPARTRARSAMDAPEGRARPAVPALA